MVLFTPARKAGIAQLVEQLICNQQVIGSSPIAGSIPEGDAMGAPDRTSTRGRSCGAQRQRASRFDARSFAAANSGANDPRRRLLGAAIFRPAKSHRERSRNKGLG